MKDGELDPTQAAEATTAPTGSRSIAPSAITAYELREVIGRGGMGEVVAARDPRIERDVAIKRMRGSDPSDATIHRFLREAKIQARLDHPAIVPVHEIGHDADGLPYFTMKRLAGTTLTALLAGGQATQQRLLRALVDVCLAVELAHTRKIVHRDIKPSNIMLGDFGEVYVIDWGVARDLEQPHDESSDAPTTVDGTQTGTLLGTPGYMSPEQAHGSAVGPSADVYSLGAILFEVLAGEPLHPRGTAALASTLGEVEASPVARRPERAIPPELDAACFAALATDPAARPSARELGDRIQRYLDGDRDVERRRALATEELDAARAALAAGDHTTAIRKAGRAFALDPDSDAGDVVMGLITDEPKETPAELERIIETVEDKLVSARSQRALTIYAGGFALVPLTLFLPVTSWPLLSALVLAFAGMIVVCWYNWRRSRLPLVFTLVGHFVLGFLFAQLASPLLLTPMVLGVVLMSMTSHPWINERPGVVLVWTAATVMAPFVAGWLGWITPTWNMTETGMLSSSAIFGTSSGSILIAANLFTILMVASYARNISRDRRLSERRIHTQLWNFRQLLPDRTKARTMTA